jgi:hypothetical protein
MSRRRTVLIEHRLRFPNQTEPATARAHLSKRPAHHQLPSRSALAIGKGSLFSVGAIYQLTNSSGNAIMAIARSCVLGSMIILLFFCPLHAPNPRIPAAKKGSPL